ncbi:hypothetical protein GYMLUDRAFT_63257 [Collybiopsis luxurians FD-317 M1]|uniref:Uncharacterized protein n=1 Tax=Collybiopsis luxurians FD-317 M1 TaxID=944289 RepID=A0A0D0CH98_9AGAR|nr:hypothetical protein GYMLUDRAFT_63257 [Collybiopsis luxurians FD-317 M1]
MSSTVQDIFDEIWNSFEGEYQPDATVEVHFSELLDAFRQYPDVFVTPDGYIRYEPGLISEKPPSDEGRSEHENLDPEPSNEGGGSEDQNSDADITLVEVDLLDLTKEVNNEEDVFPALETQVHPFDLTVLWHSHFVEFCDECDRDVLDHNSPCTATEDVFPALGTQVHPINLTILDSDFVELGDECGRDILDHDTT